MLRKNTVAFIQPCIMLCFTPPPTFSTCFCPRTHAEEYSPVSAEVRIFIILTLRRFRIMKNYQPLDSCPDVRSFQLCLGNQARRRENRGERMASTREQKRTAKCSLLKNLFSHLSAGVNAVKTISAEQMEWRVSSVQEIQSNHFTWKISQTSVPMEPQNERQKWRETDERAGDRMPKLPPSWRPLFTQLQNTSCGKSQQLQAR